MENVRDTELFKALTSHPRTSEAITPDNVAALCKSAYDRMKRMPAVHPQFTLHDETHLLRVTDLMSLVLGEILPKLNPVEIALLILAGHFHDQGLISDETDWEVTSASEEFAIHRELWMMEHPNLKELETRLAGDGISEGERRAIRLKLGDLEDAMQGDYLRKNHGQRSAEFVTKLYGDDERLYVQGVSVVPMLASLCRSHVQDPRNLKDLHTDQYVGNVPVNLRYLAIVLRLADVLDFDRERTPDSLYRTIHFTNQVSVAEWEKHRGVRGWVISRDLIRFEMEFDLPIYERTARQFIDYIEQELVEAQELARAFPGSTSAYRIPLPSRVDRSRIGPRSGAYKYYDLEFSLSRDEIVKLLMTDKLYGAPALCVRELLQNSLDALRYRKALFLYDGLEWEGVVKFKHGINAREEEFLRCTDNGVGMDEQIIQNFLTRVGRSFYRSPYFEQERLRFQTKNVDFDPCSQFGIGFMSCFMLGDRIRIETRRDYGQGTQKGPPLIVEINGLNSILTLREGPPEQPVGTVVEITLRHKRDLLAEEDQVKLLRTIKEYALAVDFPVEAKCNVPNAQGSDRIPPGLRRQPTYLESTDLKKQLLLVEKISISDKTGTIEGFVSQSFLTDERGSLTIANDEAAWEEYDPTNQEKISPVRISSARRSEFRLRFGSGEIRNVSRKPAFSSNFCADGIRVHHETPHPHVHVAAASLIDTRGKAKPELTPSRTATQNGESWSRLRKLQSRAEGMLWAKLAEYIPERLTFETWWQLTRIYGAPLGQIPANVVWARLRLPVGHAESPSYRAFSDIHEILFREASPGSGVDGYRLATVDGELILPEYQWLVLSLSELRHNNGHLVLALRAPSEGEFLQSTMVIPAGKATLKSEQQALDAFTTSFAGDLERAAFVSCGPTLGNCKHPLFLFRAQRPFRMFLSTLFYELMQAGPCLSTSAVADDRRKMVTRQTIGKKCREIRWSQVKSELQPPYPTFSEVSGWGELTLSELSSWADIELPKSEE